MARSDHRNLRDTILTAALEILDDGDAEDITIRRVAEMCGISQGAIYLHFQSRDELVYEAAYGHFFRSEQRLGERLASEPDAMRRIDERGRAYIEYALAHPAAFHAAMMGTGRERTPDRYEGVPTTQQTNTNPLIEDVQAAMDAGQIAQGDAAVTAMVLWMGVHGAAALMISLPGFPWPPALYVTDATLAFQQRALRAPVESA